MWTTLRTYSTVRLALFFMRWDRLVDDLEAQFAAEVSAEQAGQTAEMIRAELATVHLADRIRGATNPLGFTLSDGSTSTGQILHVGADWVVVRPEQSQGTGDDLIPLAAIDVVDGLGTHTAVSDHVVRLTSVLRALQRDRMPLTIRTRSAHVRGKLIRVSRDHIDVVEGRERYTGRSQARTVRIEALVVVRESSGYAEEF